jgi:hypothetical protein
MDELRRLRGLMKEKTFKNHGFSEEMRKNILDEIHTGKRRSFHWRKPAVQTVMSAVFVLGCLTFFVYLGGSQSGLFKDWNNTTQADFHQLELTVEENDDKKWSEEIKLPTVAPFEVVDRTYKSTHEDGFDNLSIKLIGPEKQTLTIKMMIGLESGSPEIYEAAKIGDLTGSYRENREWRTSNLTWFNDGIFYSMNYNPRKSDVILRKEEMVKVAESFED